MTIPDEAVEAAFRSMYGPGPSNPANDGDAHLLKELRKALEAAAPHILADAFEVVADELDGKRLLTKPFHEYYPEWLRTRANELKTTNPYRSQA